MLPSSSSQQNHRRIQRCIVVVFFFSNIKKKATMAASCCRFLRYNNTTQENNQKKWKEGRELTFKLPLYPLTSGSNFKCIILVAISTLLLQAPNSALPLQALPSFDDGVSAKWGEVGRREKLWDREEAEKTKNLGQGRMWFWFIPKTAWKASFLTSALVAAG